MQKAWQDNPEPPDHDEPTLRDRLEAMPKEDLIYLILDIDNYSDAASATVGMFLRDWEQDQLAKLATP